MISLKNESVVFSTFLLTLILNIYLAHASFEDLTIGARHNALAGAGVALSDDPDALYVNPGGLSQIKTLGATLFYARPFGMKELSYGNFSAVLPWRDISIGLGVQSYGNQVYKENTFSSSFSHHLTRHLFVGATLKYAHLAIPKYGSTGTVSFDFGLLVHINQRWKWGFSSRNLNNPKIGQDREPLPQIFQTGVSTQLAENLVLNCDVYKDVRFPLDLRCGVETRPFHNLILRVGVGNEPSRFAAGMGLVLGKLRWDYAFYTHSDLGFTHQMSISFLLKP